MNLEKKRILVVDDEPGHSRLVKLHLEQTGDFVVCEENDARAALATALEFHPDLILMDVQMPGVDGAQLSARFMANAELKTVPVVFLTSAITKGEVDAMGGLRGGAPFLAKPFVLSEMVACIQHHLRR